MFQINDYVLTVGEGICRITDITTMEVSGTEKEYFVLTSVKDAKATSFIPKETAEKLMRHLMNPEEAMAVVEDIPNVEPIKVSSERFRYETYRSAFKTRNPKDLVSLMKHIQNRKKLRELKGKILSFTDETTFTQAFDLLSCELSYSLGEEQNEVRVKLGEQLSI